MITYKLEPELVKEGQPNEIDVNLLLSLISPTYIETLIEDSLAIGLIAIDDGEYVETNGFGAIRPDLFETGWDPL